MTIQRNTPVRQLRHLQPSEKQILKSWRKLDYEVDEFYACWTRWKNWDIYPPIVVLIEGEIVGYHGATFNKPGKGVVYATSASQFVLPEHRGKGLAGAMISCLLSHCDKRGVDRLRFRTGLESTPGYSCWSGLNILPFGIGQGNYWWDIAIGGIANVYELIATGPALHLPPTTCKRRLSYYHKVEVEGLTPEWVEVLR